MENPIRTIAQFTMPLGIIALCLWYYHAIQKEHVTVFSQRVIYHEGLRFDRYVHNIYYNENGAEYVMQAAIFELDSLVWAEMKASGTDMLIKDAVIIAGLPRENVHFQCHEGNEDRFNIYMDKEYLISEYNNDKINEIRTALRADIDFSENRWGAIYWNHKSNFFGNNERGFKIYYDFRSTSNFVRDSVPILSAISLFIPPDMKFNVIPRYSYRYPNMVCIEKDELAGVSFSGLYMEGSIPKNAKNHDSKIFVLGAITGAFASLWLGFFYGLCGSIWQFIKMKFRKKKNLGKTAESG